MAAVRKKKLKLVMPTSKPRNPLVAPALQRKAGAHLTSKAKEREKARRAIRRSLSEEVKIKPSTPRAKDDA